MRALELYDFDAVMFPLNWHMHMEHGMGERIRRAVKDKGLGLLGIKSMVDRAFLAARLPQVQGQPFYDPECYQL